MVSKAGVLEGFSGKITGAGATSIQEHRLLNPLAIVSTTIDVESELAKLMFSLLLPSLEREFTGICFLSTRVFVYERESIGIFSLVTICQLPKPLHVYI